MLVREYTDADLDALLRMRARQGFNYAFPDLADPIFVSKLVVEDDDGYAVMASLARLTCEMYLLVDRDYGDRSGGTNGEDAGGGPARRSPQGAGGVGNPRERYAHLVALHRAGEQDLLARGLEDAHAWLPPPIARRFGRRLESLGWIRDDAWTPYCRRLRDT
jgi:hypothetical protein